MFLYKNKKIKNKTSISGCTVRLNDANKVAGQMTGATICGIAPRAPNIAMIPKPDDKLMSCDQSQL